jgi:hypothetical protein
MSYTKASSHLAAAIRGAKSQFSVGIGWPAAENFTDVEQNELSIGNGRST